MIKKVKYIKLRIAVMVFGIFAFLGFIYYATSSTELNTLARKLILILAPLQIILTIVSIYKLWKQGKRQGE